MIDYIVFYECSDKHKHPWQRGRKGSLCPRTISKEPQSLLNESINMEGKRYATCDGQCFCAQEHRQDFWHGYPIGWQEVPESQWRRWLKDGKITKGDIQRYWQVSS
jgi:hypothetical protein